MMVIIGLWGKYKVIAIILSSKKLHKILIYSNLYQYLYALIAH